MSVPDCATLRAIRWLSRGGDLLIVVSSTPPRPLSDDEVRMTESVLHLFDHVQDVPVLAGPDDGGADGGRDDLPPGDEVGIDDPGRLDNLHAGAAGPRPGQLVGMMIHLHREREMAELLGIPYERHTQIGMFPVAYTIGDDFHPGARRPVGDVAAWNAWPTRAR